MAVHCAAIAKTLLESELFGHERGAFTGAVSSKQGKFERADGGTLFLDEVSEIDPDIQVKLLRFLEQWEFERVGGTRLIKVDVRLVAATNRNLTEMVEKGSFREDLYYRLNVVKIPIPPLRDRTGDISILANHFAAEIARDNGKPVPTIAPDAMAAFQTYAWPGNVRELRNCIESIIVFLREGDEITLDKVPPNIRSKAETGVSIVSSFTSETPSSENAILLSPGTSLQDAERLLIEETLRNNNFNISQAARILDISRRTLHRKINEYNIKNPQREELDPNTNNQPSGNSA